MKMPAPHSGVILLNLLLRLGLGWWRQRSRWLVECNGEGVSDILSRTAKSERGNVDAHARALLWLPEVEVALLRPVFVRMFAAQVGLGAMILICEPAVEELHVVLFSALSLRLPHTRV